MTEPRRSSKNGGDDEKAALALQHKDDEGATGVADTNNTHTHPSLSLHQHTLHDSEDKEDDVVTIGEKEENKHVSARVPNLERTQTPTQTSSRSLRQQRSATGASRTTIDPAGGVPSPAEENDAFLVRWDGGDADPLCPRSMRPVRKWMLVFITCFGSACVSIYASSYDGMQAEFGNSTIISTLGLSTFVLGIALGPAWSPLSEFYGRRPIYLASFVLFLIWIVPTAVAKNIATVIVSRFFQGFTGAAFLSVSGGTVGDLFSPDTMQGPMALFSTMPFIGPSMGPLFGGFINSNVNWRWTHYVMIIWAFCLLIALIAFAPETYHPVLLRRKAAAKRAATGDDRWHAPGEIEAHQASVIHSIGMALLRPFQLIAFEPMCLALDLYSAVLLGILYLFFGAFPLVFMHNHGFNVWQCGLSFMGLFVGVAIAGSFFQVWGASRHRLMLRRQHKTGSATPVSEPEDRLPSVMVASVFVPVGIFWFGWSTYPSVHWIVPIIGSAFFGMGMLWAFSGIFTFLVDAYPRYAASALAGNAFVRCMFAAAFPLFGVQMYDNLGYQWASSLLAFLAVAMLPFPFIFFKHGKKLRAMSRFATS